MKFYDAKNQILIIRYEDFMNREAGIPMSHIVHERLEGIKANADMRLANMDLTPYRI